ncbi:NHLM bacteriocin system ABC transporter peptidase/ATP-binding protein [Saccharopolyspora lacisalsi]|uniref:NHLM bacteriocin system ABC transporter peptidase/ATP-binding protein n=1 Tax=Halosaccharopolyspora lacisalsi TaxID=1000566 RepID=A0A839E8A2_9PSEU|nr:cysteine peptidase family C39 domain-containing protein [Halosaccharopolyspora lacisalsi]MBA8827501.1 NHLM bacteriocin system ABC transporter peptidase/ATP-binding protein [Halosaccharopolyspora lacisalsi]
MPTVIQMESLECGAAALAMVLGHHGRAVALDELRALCGASRDGARAASVMAAARRYGLRPQAFQLEPEELDTLPKPLVVYWAFQHFLVVEEIRRSRGRREVVVNDPAVGRSVYSWEYFDSGFTGVALTFEVTEEFEPIRRSNRWIPRPVPHPRLAAVGGLVAGLLMVVAGLAEAALLGAFFGSALPKGRGFLRVAGAMLLIAAAVFVLAWIRTRCLRLAAAGHARERSTRLLHHLLRLPIDFFAQRRPSELDRRLSASTTVAEFLSRERVDALVDATLVVGCLTVVLAIDPLLGIAGIGVTVLHVAVLRWIARRRGDSVSRLRADRGNLTAASANILRLIEVVKASGAESESFARWAGFRAKVTTGEQRLGRLTTALTGIPPMIAVAGIGLVLLIGGPHARSGSLTVGALVVCVVLLHRVHDPVARIDALPERVRTVRADLERIDDVERHPVAVLGESPVSPVPASTRGHLRVHEVTFGYAPLEAPAVEAVSFEVAPGRKVALVGGSGSGKSTIGKLVAGLHEPWSGELVVGGTTNEPATEILGYVDQEAVLFEGTVRDNVTLWDDALTDRAVTEALRAAALTETISRLPGGIDAPVAEGAHNFSGGQRQRITLARALVRDPALLVLDEATSALDTRTEKSVVEDLRLRGCGVLVIAHRLSTVRDADEIIVLDGGRVVQRGSHEDLIEKPGPYVDLIAAS